MLPRIIAFDIETTNLKANVGRCVSFSACDLIGKQNLVTFRGDDKKYMCESMADDSLLVKDIKEYLENSWMWASWYGKMFDVPFLNTRLLLNGMERLQPRLHIDMLYYSRRPNMTLTSSRLDTVAKTFQIASQKVDLLPKEWLECIYLEPKAMNQCVRHNINDVKALRELFPILAPFVANIHK